MLMMPASTTAPAAPRFVETPGLALVLPDGRCEARAATDAAVADAVAAIDRARDEAAAMMERLAADAVSARFAAARERVPAFGAWAYDWVHSYITSFRMLGALVREVAEQTADGAVPTGERIVDRMSEPMRQAFRDRVLAPEAIAPGLAEDLANAAAMVETFWLKSIEDAVEPLRALPVAQGGASMPRLDLAALTTGAAGAMTPGEALGGMAGGAQPGGDPASVFLHSMRPMAARLSAVAVRASEAGPLLAAGGAFGYALGGAPGLAVGAAGGIGVYWAIDWGLNRVDAALNRADFEAQALAVVARAEAAIVAEMREATVQAFATRLPSLPLRERGCPARAEAP